MNGSGISMPTGSDVDSNPSGSSTSAWSTSA
jgi:hypothetical protein